VIVSTVTAAQDNCCLPWWLREKERMRAQVKLPTTSWMSFACLCLLPLAFGCFCLLLFAFACFCLLLLAFACFCLRLLAFACFCLLLLAFACFLACLKILFSYTFATLEKLFILDMKTFNLEYFFVRSRKSIF
jgi:hypothetical protein